eukprot:m.14408 g.14408  ORF g.14408 m.14408 type:complete len:53 (+) comp4302_c0_seq1:1722-1880(+)
MAPISTTAFPNFIPPTSPCAFSIINIIIFLLQFLLLQQPRDQPGLAPVATSM